MQNHPPDFQVDTLRNEYSALEADAQGIAKRLWWLVGATIVGIMGCMRLAVGGRTAAEFRHSFGDFGATAVMWALLIGSVWLLVDFLRGRTIKARRHAVHLELRNRGLEYDFSQRCWTPAAHDQG